MLSTIKITLLASISILLTLTGATNSSVNIHNKPSHHNHSHTQTQQIAPQSVWETQIKNAPVAANSQTLVNDLVRQINTYYGHAALNYADFGYSVNTANADTPTTTVIYDDCQNKGYTPTQVYDDPGFMNNVPIPATAKPAPGTDMELSIWQPSTDTLWELWQAHHETDGWHACWGGRINHISTSNGQFDYPTGVSASGLAVAPAGVTLHEVKTDSIHHAMALNIVDAATYTQFSYPANRSDGYDPDGTHPIMEGQRFKLKKTVNLKKLHLTPTGYAIARAAKKYGFIVVDKAGAVVVAGVNDNQDGQRWQKWFDRTGYAGYDQLRNFPWKKMQALPVNYGKPSSGF